MIVYRLIKGLTIISTGRKVNLRYFLIWFWEITESTGLRREKVIIPAQEVKYKKGGGESKKEFRNSKDTIETKLSLLASIYT